MHSTGISWHLCFIGMLTCLCLTIQLECPSPAVAQEDPVVLFQNFHNAYLPHAVAQASNAHSTQLLLDLSDSGDVRIKYGKTSLTIACNLDTPDDRHRQQPPSMTTPPQLQASTMPGLNLMLTFAF